jgi:hypothetical protein
MSISIETSIYFQYNLSVTTISNGEITVRYTNKFTDDELLSIITDEPMSTVEVCRQLQCCRSTATNRLRLLEAAGKVKKTYILGSMNYGWVKNG